MEAHYYRAAVVAACLLSLGASHRTQNFLVTARTKQLSVQVAEEAERLRRDLALEWLDSELPDWREPCPIKVVDGPNLGAGGATSFMFDNGRPFGWTMTIQGTPERILDSVLPHEITHTIFATHFGRPLPRWADEGACTTVEDISERQKQERMLIEFLTTRRGIAFNDMFAMTEYPRDVLPLYAQGFSLARFLIAHGGKRQFVKYVGDGMRWNNWTRATREHYGFQNLSELQVTWLDWVKKGYPPIEAPLETLVANDRGASDSSPRAGGREIPVQTVSTASEDSLAVVASSQVVPLKNGWYARSRDKAYAARSESKATSDDDGLAYRSAAAPGRTVRGQSVTRPQPPVRPRQRVIEWTNSGRMVPLRQVQPATPRYLAAPRVLGPTYVR